MTDILDGFGDYSFPDWDAEGALPITAETMATARYLLGFMPPDAQIDPAPGADGTVGFEITLPDGRELWLDAGPGKKVVAYIPERGWSAALKAPKSVPSVVRPQDRGASSKKPSPPPDLLRKEHFEP